MSCVWITYNLVVVLHYCLQLTASVAILHQQIGAVSSSNAAAVTELVSKVDGMQSDIGQIKELLTALVAKQQG